uniref:Uncharacterized protein LOC101510790 n=1 Tax=Cicer arietinum TaxID=3827 RepID=A0A1S2Z5J6_CICAR|nr:uncharacterized protein LOC101510790 [Cicer arietinum]XP_027186663.1 uncharacterized protein LOC101510790 [Cicer arietinum]XP_027186664.1 uncharacterized protein LOC101510790 [Cicer arietinum]XP_027186665.1 uncharacterized protein LOC101510790 [Cicer arietinum]XP_027186666.1 uncharacterized protein LOC101510790 [Cicer arietinum]
MSTDDRILHSSIGLRNTRAKMEKRITLLQTVATAGVFSAVSFWYGFMFGRESSRKELSQLIEDLRRGNPTSPPPPHS